MRKNIYDEKVEMISPKELIYFIQNTNEMGIFYEKYKEVLNALMIEEQEIALITSLGNNSLSLYNAIKTATNNMHISQEDIMNAYLFAIMTKNNKYKNVLEQIIIERDTCGTYQRIEQEYGEDVLNYILSNKDYSYVYDYNPIIRKDKTFNLLNENGTLVNVELEEEKIKNNSR